MAIIIIVSIINSVTKRKKCNLEKHFFGSYRLTQIITVIITVTNTIVIVTVTTVFTLTSFVIVAVTITVMNVAITVAVTA